MFTPQAYTARFNKRRVSDKRRVSNKRRGFWSIVRRGRLFGDLR